MKVRFKKTDNYPDYETWLIITSKDVVGSIVRHNKYSTRTDAYINNKCIYSNGFDSIKTAKSYVKDFIADFI